MISCDIINKFIKNKHNFMFIHTLINYFTIQKKTKRN